MSTNYKLNFGRWILGGAVAGLVIFLLTGIVNGVILNSQMQEWMTVTGGLLHPLPQSTAMVLWAVMSLLYGLFGVWIYTLLRPGLGAGPKTALIAGGTMWLGAKLTMALDIIALGLFPAPIMMGQILGSCIATIVGVAAGAWLYRE